MSRARSASEVPEPDRIEGRTIARRYLEDLLTSCQEKRGTILVAVADVHTIIGFVCLWLEHEHETYLSTLTDYAYISDLVVRAPLWTTGNRPSTPGTRRNLCTSTARALAPGECSCREYCCPTQLSAGWVP